MKPFLKYTICLCLLGFALSSELAAQSFFGYQTIGRNTFFFSVAWQGKPLVGAGYNYRIFGNSFSDISAEIRFPLNSMYTFDEYQLIAGWYKPLALQKTFVAVGSHLRLQKETNGDQQVTKLLLALTGLPSYAYVRSLTDGGYGTAGLRITYAPVLFASVKGGDSQALAAHRLEIGAHMDLHLERSMGLSLNGFLYKSFTPTSSILTKNPNWRGAGDFYWGSTYLLNRN